jgi:hypothetical protein
MHQTNTKNMTSFLRSTLLGITASALLPATAAAAFTFTNGDLILGFHATSGEGAQTNVYFNLGSATSYRDGSFNPNLGNIGGTLSTVFGSNWYDRNDVYFGAVANLSDKYPTGSGKLGSVGAVNGDPSLTIYASRPSVGVGQSVPISGLNFESMVNPAKGITTIEGTFAALGAGNADGTLLISQTANPTLWESSWSYFNNPSYSFTSLPGIEQHFGGSGDSTFLDIQRILSISNGANPSGTVGTGEYIATAVIGRDGSIGMIPEPSVTLLTAAAALAATARRRRTTSN